MNKQDNKLALSVVTTLISGIALIYTLIMYHNIIFAVMGMSLIFLICAYILTQNLIAFSNAKAKATDVQIREYIGDISEQLETMQGSQAQLGKATFLYTKQAAKAVATLENNYIESQEALYKNLSSISSAQNKATKLMIKYDQSNTTKVISTIKELRNQLSDTMIQGFDQIQPNNAEVVEALEDIVNYLKSQPAVPDQTLSLQLNNVAHELQNISQNIQHFQVPVQTVVQGAPTMTTSVADIPTPTESLTDIKPAESTELFENTELAENFETFTNTESIADTDLVASVQDIAIEEPAPAETIDVTPEPIIADISAEPITETAINEEPTAETMSLDDPNKQLSADEIAALFAAAEPAPKKVEETTSEVTAEPIEEEEPFTPTFTVVGKSSETVTPEKTVTPTIGDVTDDPNKQLSADEIAALFAAAEPAPKKEEKPVEQPSVTPVTDDPNKQLSADEIAALFAAAEPAPKKDSTEEEKLMDAAIAQAEPVPITPVSDDPNKQLSADEIAALFASLG